VGEEDSNIIYYESQASKAPTDLKLSSTTIEENSPDGTVVGTFSTTDPDGDTEFTYQLVPGPGDADNFAFTIKGDQLLLEDSPDYEEQSSYSILVQTTDEKGLSYSENLIINVSDLDDPVLVVKSNPWLANVGDNISPTFVDLDGDGDLDLFVGEKSGNIIYYENSGTRSSPTFGKPQTNPFKLADVGDNISPTFVDLDGDGDEDLFVGNRSGDIIYYENQGTRSSPTFGKPQTHPFGFTHVGRSSSPTFADLDGDGDKDLFVGESRGNIIYYEEVAAPPLVGQDNKDNSLRGTTNNETISGLGGDDQLMGKEGDDTLIGGLGNDRLNGDEGKDVFVLAAGHGQDRIRDFENGTDSLGLIGGLSYSNLEFVSQGQNTLINFRGETLATLLRVPTRLIDMEDFITIEAALPLVPAGKNSPPTDLKLSSSSIDGNSPANTVVGILSTVDSNPGDIFTYQITHQIFGSDNAAFTIAGDQLLINIPPNTRSDYSIRVQTTDAAGESYSKRLRIGVTTPPIVGQDNQNDRLHGTAKSETISGLGGDDWLKGKEGNDTLIGGLGNDRLNGGEGRDVFVLAAGHGQDKIEGFKDGIDSIGLTGGLSFSDLRIASHGPHQKTRIFINETGEVLATLLGIESNLIGAEDFTTL